MMDESGFMRWMHSNDNEYKFIKSVEKEDVEICRIIIANLLEMLEKK